MDNRFIYLSTATMSQEILQFIRHVNKKSKKPLRSLTRLIEYSLITLIKYYEKSSKSLKLAKLKLMHSFLHTDSSLTHDFIADMIEIYQLSILTTLQEIILSFYHFHKNRSLEKHSMPHMYSYNTRVLRNELSILIQYPSSICLNLSKYSTLSIKRNHNHSGYIITGTNDDNTIFLQRFSADEKDEAIDAFLKELGFSLYYIYDIFNNNSYYQERVQSSKKSGGLYRQLNMNVVQIPQFNAKEEIPSYRRSMSR